MTTSTLNPRPLSLRASIAAVLGSAAMYGTTLPAVAQDADAGARPGLEEIRVTGSRIVRRDFEANSPLVTIESDTFENVSTIAIESMLNQLPQFTPALTQFDTSDVQNSATNTVGASTLDLRGLGSNRNLVLFDGRRGQPVNASFVVDINSVPSAAVERVEIITGGASAVYGADAVSGVVNFILKRDFDGFEVDTQYGITQQGDGTEFRASILTGANLDNGRGNVMFGLEHSQRGTTWESDRSFYRSGWADPGSSSGRASRISDFYFNPAGNNPDPAVLEDIFGGPGVASGNVWISPETGTVYQDREAGAAAYQGPMVVDGNVQYRQFDNDGILRENTVIGMISNPFERWSTFGALNYDITDSVTFVAQGNFATTNNRTHRAWSPAAGGWSVQLPWGDGIYEDSLDPETGQTRAIYQEGGAYGLSCAPTGGCTNREVFPVPAELAALLDSRADPDAPFQMEGPALKEIGPRGIENQSTTYQLLAGLEGGMPFGDWTWETNASYGRTTVLNQMVGTVSVENYRAIATQPNFGRRADLTGNTTISPAGFGGKQVTCESGLQFFSETPLTQDCIDAIEAEMTHVTQLEQGILEANFQGGLFELPAGEVRAAVGASYRENDFSYKVDHLEQVQNIIDLPAGLFGSGSTYGSIDATEVYGELLVPVVGDLTYLQRMDLELGYRYSDYSSVGGKNTYKILSDVRFTDAVRLRGGYNYATRAPNIAELFMGATQAVTISALGDPCIANTQASYGNVEDNPDRQQVIDLCNALIADPMSDYSQDPTGYRADESFNWLVLANSVGNPNVQEEVAKTWTAGIVLASTSEHPLLRRLSASVDWYSIRVEGSIGQLSYDGVHEQCFSGTFNPGYDVNNEFCQLLQRDVGTGDAGPPLRDFRNLGLLQTEGMDFQINWSAELADMGMNLPGTFGITLLANYLDSYEVQELPDSDRLNWAGTTGMGYQYRYRTFTTLRYANNNYSMSLRHRFLPGLTPAAFVTNPDADAIGPGSYSIFDLNGRWTVNEYLELRGGIDNLLDRSPALTSRSSTNTGVGSTNERFYDVLGRRAFLGLKARF